MNLYFTCFFVICLYMCLSILDHNKTVYPSGGHVFKSLKNIALGHDHDF